ncbi:hypothetical protein P5P86_19525 [Nocardioides sp. BP30]|uniref:hypothetical protein n=1 Tax=Nocardioides sp. BP30 TaxID=3036374 RepID=UPI00246984A3|nr:hypothetical protein [Nocardioides sp. BP30]WGL52129.1 hypothetical protein P5P86_19525 [Nocardioides sp. BP30]
MILVNVRKSGSDAITSEQLRDAAAGDWVIAESNADAYGDVLLGVRRNVVVGAYDILGWEAVESGRIRFEVVDSEEFSGLVGAASPLKWKRGQANPVLYLDTSEVAAAEAPSNIAASAVAPRKPRRAVHRVVIETKGLDDDAAARLHHALITVAASTGCLHDYRTTSQVGEMRRAQEATSYTYVSAKSPVLKKE